MPEQDAGPPAPTYEPVMPTDPDEYAAMMIAAVREEDDRMNRIILDDWGQP